MMAKRQPCRPGRCRSTKSEFAQRLRLGKPLQKAARALPQQFLLFGDYPVRYVYKMVVRVFAMLSVMFIAQTVMAGMPRFPVKPLPRYVDPVRCSIQRPSSTTSEPKSEPYSDFSDHQSRVIAMTLCGSGSKRTNQRACSHSDAETSPIDAAVFTANGIRLSQSSFLADPSGTESGVVLRC